MRSDAIFYLGGALIIAILVSVMADHQYSNRYVYQGSCYMEVGRAMLLSHEHDSGVDIAGEASVDLDKEVWVMYDFKSSKSTEFGLDGELDRTAVTLTYFFAIGGGLAVLSALWLAFTSHWRREKE